MPLQKERDGAAVQVQTSCSSKSTAQKTSPSYASPKRRGTVQLYKSKLLVLPDRLHNIFFECLPLSTRRGGWGFFHIDCTTFFECLPLSIRRGGWGERPHLSPTCTFSPCITRLSRYFRPAFNISCLNSLVLYIFTCADSTISMILSASFINKVSAVGSRI
jgi:hypothetical protein